MRRQATSLLLAALLVALPVAHARQAPATDRSPHKVSYDRYSLRIDGKRLYVWSGSFHYWRLPSPGLWKDVLQKMKAGGYNAVEIYFNWNFHSPRRGAYDFSGVRDVDRLLDMAAEVGIYVIARPGPYINAETDGGGLPGWLVTEAGKPRSTAPDYTAAYREWMSHIDPIIARHQISNGTGTVILYQIENELYDRSPDSHRYLKAIEDKARADGIDVPFIGNHNAGFQDGTGAVDIPGYDSYPQGFDCSHPNDWRGFYAYHDEREALTKSPLFFPEYQGGAFDTWGGPGYDRCRALTGPAFERVFYEANMASGSTMQSFYMTYGGTNWGWLASPGVYTSYDYGAAITESRQLTAKYAQQKLIGYFVHSVASLAKTDAFKAPTATNPTLRVDGRLNPDDGTRFYFLRHEDVTSTSDERTHVWLDLAAGTSPARRIEVPQQAGTSLRIHGRDAKILLANYHFGHQWLAYSTSEWLTSVSSPTRDVAVIYGRAGEDGETVLHYAGEPKVHVVDGQVATRWDAAAKTLRLNYRHHGLSRVIIGRGDHALLLLIGDNATAERFWTLPTARGPVLVRGPHLVRTASLIADADVALTGDTDRAGELELFAPEGMNALRWNGQPVAVQRTPVGSLLGALPGPRPVSLPVLTRWRHHAGAPETATGFDDSRWRSADLSTTTSTFWNGQLPILDSDDYGFHHGNVWYRGHFVARGTERHLLVHARTGIHDGNNGVFGVWLNGHWIDARPGGEVKLDIDPSSLNIGRDNVLSVLVDNMGHNQEGHSGDSQEPRGLASATLTGAGAPTPIRWRIQGSRGGESPVDAVRGPLNNGGLYGERMGWSLPGFPDHAWASVALPAATTRPGVDWYRTTVDLALPSGQDVPVALKIEGNPDRHYRALVFVNGWQVGRYVNDIGPQHVFPIPTGVLDPHGHNTVAIAVWSTGDKGGLGHVSLISQGNLLSPLSVPPNAAPPYDKASYGP